MQIQEQLQTLKLFHNLIKLHHDGLVITQDDRVVFYNRQAGAIFNVKRECGECESEWKKMELVEAFKGAQHQRGARD